MRRGYSGYLTAIDVIATHALVDKIQSQNVEKVPRSGRGIHLWIGKAVEGGLRPRCHY